MDIIFGFISVLSVCASALLLARMLRVHARVAFVLAFAVLLSTIIVLQGYLLSTMNQLNNLLWWALIGVITLMLAALPLAFSKTLREVCLRKPEKPVDIEKRIAAVDKKSFNVRLLIVLAVTVGMVAAINFIGVATLEPATPDAHQYHLARMVHYLQQGNLGYFDAGYWAQVVYPKVATVLHLYAYLTSGFTCLTQLVQFIAYLIGMLAVYGVCRQLGQRRQAAAFAGFIFGLLIICLTEASTAQNDLILTAFIGAAIYFVLAYREWRSPKYLVLAMIAFALAVGVKATFLVTLPPLALIAGYALFARPAVGGRHLAAALAALVVALAVITLPSGYWDNLRRFNDPFGPPEARQKYTQEQKSLGEMAGDGALNVLRYGVDFLVLDGWHPVPGAEQAQAALTAIPRAMFTGLNIDLESLRGARPQFPFSYRKHIRADETMSSWGMLGFLLLWPAVLLVLLFKRSPTSIKVFAVAALLYYLVLCFIVPYDPFHGRFFTTGALFALPPLAWAFAQRHFKLGRVYLGIVVVLGCVNALIAASFRTGTALVPYRDYAGKAVPSVFTLTQSQLLVREAPGLDLLVFDLLGVPQDAVIAIDVQRTPPEYLFFGDKLTRKLISLRPFHGPRKELPPEAQFLICDRTSPYFRPGGGMQFTPRNYPLGAIYLQPVDSAGK
ncbi:MAG: ArnT family glycosyltransferase [Armatimonadota bacterium]